MMNVEDILNNWGAAKNEFRYDKEGQISVEDFNKIFPSIKEYLKNARLAKVDGELDYHNKSGAGVNYLTKEQARNLADFMSLCPDKQFFELWSALQYGGIVWNMFKVHTFIKNEVVKRAQKYPVSDKPLHS